ncbi:hypothetical protein MBIO_0072 [Mycoplasmopsis fermentans PG18]|uniref:Uncharacterized protein n=1 Tax=Mycoplasmopsis fermentans (strain ATCC 19989 / NBRC 14854 / NCTC 10117 / PG18) TaxID=496833 RepID=C4XDW5_MYCFP|nr:hypothetical protein MBIO_0072 [Mycoplasmopsis fermentans PG18]
MNPRSSPWQGDVLNHFTTGPIGGGGWTRTSGLEVMSLARYQTSPLRDVIFFYLGVHKEQMAGDEGFEPPRAVKPLLVFKTSPFSQAWVITLGGPNWIRTSNQPVMSRLLCRWAIGPKQLGFSPYNGSVDESRTHDLPGMNRML